MANKEMKHYPNEFSIIEICKYMGGWSYREYMEAPNRFIEMVELKMSVDNSFINAKIKSSIKK